MYARNANEALAYLTECTLATVEDLKMKKSASKSETARQIAIAQKGVDWCKFENIDLSFVKAIRVADMINKFKGKVEDWAQEYKP